ncbi:MAG: hypothetical protein BGO87_14355 [Flavobacteriia bacterium 40-80]|nr:MAG: hypothetical protein BGO87_14355 [Flavobacteriia bacterium 40-80]
MKNYRWLLAVLPLVFFCFSKKPDFQQETAEKVQRAYMKGIYQLQEHIDKLIAEEKKGRTEEELIPFFLKARECFKRIEFLLVYVDNLESKNINGANIEVNNYTYLTPKDNIEPHGLQVIEDLLYNPDETSRAVLKQELQLFKELIQTIYNRNLSFKLYGFKEYNLIVWDAIRYELYRIEAMGITGFDVPDSQNSLPETAEALSGLQEVIQLYKPFFSDEKGKQLLSSGVRRWKQAIDYVRKNQHDFDAFDRLTFMKEHLHELQKWTKEAILYLNYEYPDEVRPVSKSAAHLFAEDFFNVRFFASSSTPEKIQLGEKLFYDTVFSAGNKRSCASCHIPEKGFADGLRKNLSIDGLEELKRNTPSLLNSIFQTKQFYDSRAGNLERQSWDVIHNEQEMGGNMALIIQALKSNPAYNKLFKNAFSNGEINQNNILMAVASYVGSLISLNSEFDQYLRGQLPDLSPEVKNGFNLFAGKAKCATCHFMPLFNGLVAPNYTDTESEILGIPKEKTKPYKLDDDLGRYTYTRLDLHRNAFKTSSVRNIELTAPYMHNGVFDTLEELMDFYNNGGGAGQGINLPEQTLSSDSLHLTKKEISDIISFMKSLTGKRNSK